MLFTSTISAMATALALLAPVAMAGDFDIRWYPQRGCGGSPGPVRELTRGVCVPLSSTTYSVNVQNHRPGMKLRGYDNGNCAGNSIVAFSSHQCHELPKVWSVRVENE